MLDAILEWPAMEPGIIAFSLMAVNINETLHFNECLAELLDCLIVCTCENITERYSLYFLN